MDNPPNHTARSGNAADDASPDTESRALEALQEDNSHSLPPHDRGKAAWKLLFAAFIFEALLWGFPLSFGVFQEYYSRLPQFQDNPFISVVGTVASGISYMAAPIAIPATKKYAKYRRYMIWVGCMLSALVAGSFASSLGTLILTQGVLYGTGFVIFYYPILSMVNEFWIDRRGFAYGILCSASGVSGAVMPFVLAAMLGEYGYATTLRAVAIALLVLTGPLIPLLRGRLPESTVVGASGRTDWSFLSGSLFWVYSISNIAMGLGYFFPALYLPSYASSNLMSATQGAALLSAMSVAQVFGQISFGYLSDRKMPISLLAALTTFTASVAVFTSWGLAHTFGLLLLFAIIYGFFAAGYTAMWGRMGTAVSSDPAASFAAFGLPNFGKGVGNVLAGPISGALISGATNVNGYGSSRYKAAVIFTGSCMLFSGIVATLDLMRPIGRAMKSVCA
ncbi:MFS-type transporter pynF [Fulvia fulva]|nr:MFS-type transporter pynF [Fulvia fulva]KAK4620980.1 MFS-type transporter pynF [Fulvia fulva]WPV17431.1 MFS-type transporter pynF [Fulvia fulva]WPV32475.1 MFS-type transporter pynF [Fulvia fulva]